MYWSDTPDGHHCSRHDFAFPRGEVCHRCVTDPGDAPGGVVDDPEYQQALRARINEYETRSRTCWRRAGDHEDGENKTEGNLAVKWSSEAVKWARLAEERREILDRRAHNLDLMRHEEAMSGERKRN